MPWQAKADNERIPSMTDSRDGNSTRTMPDLATRYAEIRRKFKGDQASPAVASATGDSRPQDMMPEELVRQFSETHPAANLADDHDGSVRFELVKQIDGRTDMMDLRYQRIAFRRKAQAAWNGMCPETPILVWSEKDKGYDSDSARGVLYRKGSALRSSPEYGPITYAVYDKATGKDVTAVIHHYDFSTRQIEEQIREVENNARLRIVLERDQESGSNRAFATWREKKRQQSRKRRYWARLTELSEQEFERLHDEFKREMPEYDLPEMTPEEYEERYSDDERRQLEQLRARRDEMESCLNQTLQDYGISSRTLFTIRCQYCDEGGTERDPLSLTSGFPDSPEPRFP